MPSVFADYFCGDKYLGRAEMPAAYTTPHQVAFFCSTCGEIWGRVVISEGGHWQLENVPCKDHKMSCVQDWGAYPGSFIQYRTKKISTSILLWAVCLETVPTGVLKHEFDILLAEALQEMEQEASCN